MKIPSHLFVSLLLTIATSGAFAGAQRTGVPVIIELGCLSTTNNYDNLVHGEFSNRNSSYEINFEVCNLPTDRPNLLAYIKTYWNKSPTITLTDPNGEEHGVTGTEIDPNQSIVLYVNIPA